MASIAGLSYVKEPDDKSHGFSSIIPSNPYKSHSFTIDSFHLVMNLIPSIYPINIPSFASMDFTIKSYRTLIFKLGTMAWLRSRSLCPLSNPLGKLSDFPCSDWDVGPDEIWLIGILGRSSETYGTKKMTQKKGNG